MALRDSGALSGPNPKHEARNPKQIQISKFEWSKTASPLLDVISSRFREIQRRLRNLDLGHSGLVSNFDIRISDFALATVSRNRER
jgi:hypothetical protein